ncbi:hypothetical protein BDR06DRAFT_764696 [Suillus hirtellus]|nr:hypothetical protein BDR06DRAFT_764696 [Suillus hirtellus]
MTWGDSAFKLDSVASSDHSRSFYWMTDVSPSSRSFSIYAARLSSDSRRSFYRIAYPNIISASDFAHSRTAVYTQLQPILLFLPWTSLIHTPRFTCSSSLLSLPQPSHIRATVYSLFHYICPELRPFVHRGFSCPLFSDFAYSRTTVYTHLQPTSAPDFAQSRTTVYTQLSLLRYDIFSTPTLHLEQNTIRNIVHSRLIQ